MRRASGLIFTIATLSAMNAALADDSLARARAATEQALSRAPVGASYCFPPVTLPAKAHVVHVYPGAAPVDPTKTARPPRYVDVKVEKTAEPVLLTLSAYEPVVWRLAVADGAAIAGVHLLGYYERLVEGARCLSELEDRDLAT